MPKTGKWATEETETLLRLMAQNLGKSEVARELNRSPGAIEARLRYLELSDIERDQMNARKVAREAATKAGQRERRNYVHSTRGDPRIDEGALEDRERRLHAPRTITAFVFGDPPVGYSALDQGQPQSHEVSPSEVLNLMPLGAPTFKHPEEIQESPASPVGGVPLEQPAVSHLSLMTGPAEPSTACRIETTPGVYLLMEDQVFDGVPIRQLPTGQVLWLLQGLQGMWKIPPDLEEAAEQCRERLRIELVARTLIDPP